MRLAPALRTPLVAFSLLLIAALAVFGISLVVGQNNPAVWTDKPFYGSFELVTITGTDFQPYQNLDVVVVRPDGTIVTGDGTNTPGFDSVQADDQGGFVYYYQLYNYPEGVYTVNVYDSADVGHTTVLATTTFIDGKISSLTLRYKNFGFGTPTDITLLKTLSFAHFAPGGDSFHGPITIAADGTFTVLPDSGAPAHGNNIGPKVQLELKIGTAKRIIDIHTSCSQPIGVGFLYGPDSDETAEDPSEFGPGGFDAGIEVVALETHKCNATLAEAITVCKEVEPPDSSTWSFTLSGPTPGTVSGLGDGQCHIFTDRQPGTYTLTETAQSGYTTSVACDSGKGSDTDNDITFTLNAGDENVICTFTNTLAQLDVEKVSIAVLDADCSSAPPSSIPVSVSVDLCVRGELRYNAGAPSSVDVTDTLSATLPPDCTASIPPIPTQTLPKGTIVTVDVTVSVHCFQPSSHTIGFQNCIAITPPPDPPESDTTNNCKSTSVTLAALAQSDVKVTGVSVSAPASASAGTAFTVSADVTLHNNGPFGPVNADTTISLNLPSACSTSSANPATVQNTSLSTSTSVTVSASWSVTCTNPSNHVFTVNASTAVDQQHVSDPNAANNSGSGSATTAVLAQADVKVAGVSVSAPASASAGTAFTVSADVTLHNNGPFGPVNADTTISLNLPSACSTSSANPQTVEDTSLTASTSVTVSASWSVTCTNPSNHVFTVNASTAVDQQHVSDPNAANNSGSGSATTAVLAQADVKVAGVSVSAPASASAGTAFTVSADVTLHNNSGHSPVNADTTISLNLPSACSTSSANPQTVEDTSLTASTSVTVSASWSVTCTNPSNHVFTVNASTAVDQQHVSDPNAANNSGSGSATTAVLAQADVKVAGVSVSAPASASAGTAFTVSADVTLHNNSGHSPVNADTTISLNLPSACSTSSANPQTVEDTSLTASTSVTVSASWSVTCTNPSNHVFTVNASTAVDQQHVSDPNAANNSGSGSATTAVLAQADVKVAGVSVSAPASASAGTAFTVSADVTLHNNGPFGPVNADTTLTLSLPSACSTSSANPATVQNTSLSTSTSVTVSASWSVTCTNPSNHVFTVNASTAVDQQHVSDPNAANNSGSGSATTAVLAQADVKVAGVSVSAPASASAGTAFTVSADVTLHNNGPFGPVNADTTISLNLPSACSTSSANPATVQNTSLSTSTSVTVSASWSVTCTNPSNHVFTVNASTAVDQQHVSDPNAANNSGSGSATTAVLAQADVKVAGVSVSAPASASAGTAFTVSADVTLHNNGPFGPVNADTTLTLSLPSACSTSSANPATVQNTSLSTSTSVTVSASWSVTCTNPSNHVFTVNASTAVDQQHVSDPNAANNSGSGSATTAVLAQADVKVAGVSVSAPASASAGTAFTVSADVTLHNNGPFGPVNADTTISLNLPSACSTSSANPQTVEDTSLTASTSVTVSASWSVTCTNPSNHVFTVNASTAVDQQHVSDPNAANNSGSGSATTAVLAQADVKVAGVSVSAPASASAGTAFTVSADVTLHNNGPFGPVNADTTLTLNLPSACSTSSANPQTVEDTSLTASTSVTVSASWSVTCTNPSNHVFTVNASTAVDQQHVSDPNAANNSGSGSATTAVLAQADVKVAGVSLNIPSSITPGDPFTVSSSAALHNNGPFGPVNSDVTITLTLPANCTTPDTNPVTVTGVSLPTSSSVTVPSSPAAWTVTCTTTGPHTFKSTAAVVVNQVHVVDPNLANNEKSIEKQPGTPPPGGTPHPVGGIAGLLDAQSSAQPPAAGSPGSGAAPAPAAMAAVGLALAAVALWLSRRRWQE